MDVLAVHSLLTTYTPKRLLNATYQTLSCLASRCQNKGREVLERRDSVGQAARSITTTLSCIPVLATTASKSNRVFVEMVREGYRVIGRGLAAGISIPLSYIVLPSAPDNLYRLATFGSCFLSSTIIHFFFIKKQLTSPHRWYQQIRSAALFACANVASTSVGFAIGGSPGAIILGITTSLFTSICQHQINDWKNSKEIYNQVKSLIDTRYLLPFLLKEALASSDQSIQWDPFISIIHSYL